MRIRLGRDVEVRAHLERDSTYLGARRWTRIEHSVPVRGIVVGYRNRHDGHMEHETSDWDGRTYAHYVADRGFPTVLIAHDLDRLPMVALPADVHEVTEDEAGDRIAQVIEDLVNAQRALVALAQQLKDEVPVEFVHVIEVARSDLERDRLSVEEGVRIAARVFAQVKGTVYRQSHP